MEAEKNLYERIQAVSIAVMNLEKDTTVGDGKNQYKAVSDNQVVLSVKKEEQRQGIISIPTKQELVHHEIVRKVKDGYESISYMDIVKMTVRIFLISDPAQYVEIESFGRGLDSGDKGLGKASTYARKYALLNAYKIATGADPDADPSKEEKTDIVDTRKQAVQDYMMKDSTYALQVSQHFGVNSFDQMTTKQIATVYDNLKAKGKI